MRRRPPGRLAAPPKLERGRLERVLEESRTPAVHVLWVRMAPLLSPVGDADAVPLLAALVGVAELAGVGRARLHGEEQQRARAQVESRIADEQLVDQVEALAAAGEPVKVIQARLKISKVRVHRIQRIAAETKDYRSRFKRNSR